MKTSEVTKGTKVITPGGETAKVTAIQVAKTGLKGRPATLFTVGGVNYRAKDLKPADQASA